MIDYCFCHSKRLFFFLIPLIGRERKSFFFLLKRGVFLSLVGRKGGGMGRRKGREGGELRLVLLSIEQEGRRREKM